MQLKQLGDINFIANAIVGAVLFTLLFLTANTMMQSVRERTPELAVLKTLGFSDGKVLTLVLIEALLLCMFAAAVGLALAALVFNRRPLQADVRRLHDAADRDRRWASASRCCSRSSAACRRRGARKQLNIVDALAGTLNGARMKLFRQIGAVTAMNLRSLPQRVGTSLVIVIGIAGVVAVLVSVLAMSTGMIETMENSGRDDRAIVLRNGSAAETGSALARDAARLDRRMPPASSATATASRSLRRKRCAW